MKSTKAIQSDMFGGDGTITRFSDRVASFKPKPKPVVKQQLPQQARQKQYGPASRVPVADAEVEHVRKTQRVKALMAGGKMSYAEALRVVFPDQFREG